MCRVLFLSAGKCLWGIKPRLHKSIKAELLFSSMGTSIKNVRACCSQSLCVNESLPLHNCDRRKESQSRSQHMPVLKPLAKAMWITKVVCKAFVSLVHVHTHTGCAACWVHALPWAAMTIFPLKSNAAAATFTWHNSQTNKNVMNYMALMWELTHTQLTHRTVCFLCLAL